MKNFALACLATYATASFSSGVQMDELNFMYYMSVHNKSYATREEFNFRKARYNQMDALIKRHNAQGRTWTLAHNKFSDWTEKEIERLTQTRLPEEMPQFTRGDYKQYDRNNVNGSVNWKDAGAVSEVKDQGQCGSCWSFSSTGALEGAYFVKHGQLSSFSEQQLVDCTVALGNHGCNGGSQNAAFEYAKTNPITVEWEYPYTAQDGTCQEVQGYVQVSDYTLVPGSSYSQLMMAIEKQPVSVDLRASEPAFTQYSSGIVTGPDCGTEINHGVLAVGYGTEDGTDYFLVKNSWGASWGDAGYIKIGMEDGVGVCGIQTYSLYPEVL